MDRARRNRIPDGDHAVDCGATHDDFFVNAYGLFFRIHYKQAVDGYGRQPANEDEAHR
jgi:hypothetical protein